MTALLLDPGAEEGRRPDFSNVKRERPTRGTGGEFLFLIFGFGRTTRKLIGPDGYFYCRSCGRDVRWMVYKLTRWFTIFFIPVIPYNREYYLSCSSCSEVIPISYEQAEQWKRSQPEVRRLHPER